MIANINFTYIVIVVLTILLIFSHASKCSIYDELVSGFYNGDQVFCEESEIDVFCLYLDDEVDSSGYRGGYILMKSGDDLVLNEPTNIRLTRHWNLFGKSSPIYYDVEFTELDDMEDFFPKCQTLKFYPATGKIVLYSDDTIYGVFYKSGAESEMKMLMADDDDL